MGRAAETKNTVDVIVCHHTGSLIDRCLKSVSESYSNGLDIHPVVVTSTSVIFKGAVTYRNFDGPAHKRNLGMTYTIGEYAVFLDDDVEVSPYCIWNLVKEMEERPNCGMGFAKILNMERRDEFDDCGSWITPTGFLFSRAQNHQKDNGQYDAPCPVLASKSATCIVRRDVFYKAGGFDKDYYILGEETDLAWRIWLTGYQCWYFPSAKSWHAFGTSLKPKDQYYTLSRIHFHGCKNYINMLLTNLSTRRLLCILPIHSCIWVVSAVGFALKGQLKRSWLILSGIFWNITNLRNTLRKRRRIQQGKKVSEVDFWSLVSFSPPLEYYWNRIFRYVGQGLHG